MELNFIEEEIPKITRVGGAGREAEPWEQHIAPLKEEGRSGKSFRVWTYGKRTSAVSRMSSVRNRLTDAVPGTEDAVHPAGTMEGETDISGTSATQHGVYVQYNGIFTDAEIAANATAHAERSARVKAARAASQASSTEPIATDATATDATEPGSDTQPTAKERVAAAKAKAGAAK